MNKMNLGKHKNLIIISAIILVLVLINAMLLLYPGLISIVNPYADDLSNYKTFSTQIHYSVQALLADSEGTLIDNEDYLFLPDDQRIIRDAINDSAREDVMWIALKENEYFEAIDNATSKEEAYSFAHKEAALYYISEGYISTLNVFAMQDSSDDKDIMDDVIQNAETFKESIKIADFLGEEFEIPEGMNFDRALFKQEALNVMAEFLELRKIKYDDAEYLSHERKFVEAEKLISLYFLFTN
ncbi:MAG: hypothetical protein V1672_01000 [Candidatus Diapherotrites archaeon]